MKRAKQGIKLYVNASKDPNSLGAWTEVTAGPKLEKIRWRSGSEPSVATFTEHIQPASGTSKAAHVPPATATVETGDGTDGILFTSSAFTLDAIIRVDIESSALDGSYSRRFMGVVTDLAYNLADAEVEITALDFRYYMNKTPAYGKYVYDPVTDVETWMRKARLTFNAKGEPDHAAQWEGPSTYYNSFLPARWNRRGDNDPGPGPGSSIWADYWTLGGIWNYLRNQFMVETDERLVHLQLGNVLTWDAAVDGGTYSWLFRDGSDNLKIPRDLAMTGMTLAQAIDTVVKRAGPYDWTLVADPSSDKVVVTPFHVLDGISGLDVELGQIGESVSDNSPLILGGSFRRSSRARYDRILGLGDKTIFEVTLSTTDGTLDVGWNAGTGGAQSVWKTAFAADDEDAYKDSLPHVFCRWQADASLDWGDKFFGGTYHEALPRPALRQLFTTAADPQAGTSGRRIRLRPYIQRSPDGGSTWEAMPACIGLKLLPDVCGFQLGTEARGYGDGEAAGKRNWPDDECWSWDAAGDGEAYDIRITIAVEADERVYAEISETVAGERPRVAFVDGANAFQQAYRTSCIIPVSAGSPVLENPASYSLFGATSPELFIDDYNRFLTTLQNRLDARNHGMLEGKVVISALWSGAYLGYRLANLLVTASGTRTTLQPNACIREVVMNVREDRTTLVLRGA